MLGSYQDEPVERGTVRSTEFSWSLVAKLATFLCLLIICIVAVASTGIRVIFSLIEYMTLQQLKKIEKKLRHWDKDYAWMLEFAEDLIEEKAPEDFGECAETVSSKAGYEHLCTYSWKNTDWEPPIPTIYVPGSARQWNPTLLERRDDRDPGPVEVNPDSGIHYIDQNVVRARAFQFEPVLQAMAVMNPSATLSDTDIIITRSMLLNLRHLLDDKQIQPFCIECKFVGNTLVISTKGKGWVHCPPESYGHNFEMMSTTATGEDDADGYYRVLKYPLGSLMIAVRIECDACLGREQLAHEQSDGSFGRKLTNKDGTPVGIEYNGATTVIASGKHIDQSSILELKTTTKGVGATVTNALPQAWFGRTSNIVVGKRQPKRRMRADGTMEPYSVFTSATMQNLGPSGQGQGRLVNWEEDNQSSLKRLVSFLQYLREVTRTTAGGKIVLRKLEKGEPIEVYTAKKDMAEAFPDPLMGMFWKGKEDEGA